MNETYQLLPPLTDEEFEALKEDIRKRGVLVPVEKDEAGNVLDGFHRVRACEELGVRDYPTIIRAGMTHEEKIDHALTLNLTRRHLSREQRRELVAKLRLEGWSTTRIADRLNVTHPTVLSDLEGCKDLQPDTVQGKDGKSYPARKPSVIARNEREARRAIEALAEADTERLPNGLIDVQQVIRAQRDREPAATPPLPQGKYRCLVIDPPWQVDKIVREERLQQDRILDYPTMTLEEIAALPIAQLADESGCHVYLWVTHKYLPDGLRLFEVWGVKYQCLMTWIKPTGMTPYSWMYDTEHVLFGRIGNQPLLRNGLRLSFEANVKGHSVKPDAFYERVALVSPEPRLEMFARSRRAGWEAWGNEIDPVAFAAAQERIEAAQADAAVSGDGDAP